MHTGTMLASACVGPGAAAALRAASPTVSCNALWRRLTGYGEARDLRRPGDAEAPLLVDPSAGAQREGPTAAAEAGQEPAAPEAWQA